MRLARLAVRVGPRLQRVAERKLESLRREEEARSGVGRIGGDGAHADAVHAAVDAAKSDPAAGAYILRETRQTYLRTSDFGWQGGTPK